MTTAPQPAAPGDVESPFHLRALGTARLERRLDDGSFSRLAVGGKVLGLLVYLSAQEGRAITRERLADLLWGDETPEHARGSLRQSLFVLRRALGDTALSADRDVVSLTPGAVSVDRDEFLLAARDGRFAEMLAAYSGAFCAHLDVRGAEAFEEWIEVERRRLRGLLISSAVRDIPRMIGEGALGPALDAARQVADLEPTDPEATACLFDALVASGAIGEAKERLEAFATGTDDLPRGISDRIARLAGLAPAAAPNGAEPLSELGQNFVGRDALFAALLREAERARAGVARRCVLVGVPGVGKTRVLDEFEARLRLRGARVVRVRCLPAMRDVPYAALADLVRELCGLPGSLGVSPRAASELVSLLPALSTCFREVRGERTPDDQLPLARRDALADLLSSVAEDRLVVLLVDDLQNADEASRQLMAAVTHPSSSRLLEVWSTRPGQPMESHAADVRVTVDAIGVADVRLFLETVAALPAEPWSADLVARLLARSGGVPQVLLQLIRSLEAQGMLAISGGSWVAPDPERLIEGMDAALGIESTIAEIPAQDQLILRVLAVWSRPMDERDLVNLLGLLDPAGGVTDRLASLRRLETLGLVQTRDTSWAVAHDTVAEGLKRVEDKRAGDSILHSMLDYWCDHARLTPELLEHLSLLCGNADSLRGARRLIRSAGGAPAVRRAGLRDRSLASEVARASGRPAWEGSLHRSIGLFARQSRLGLTVLGVTAGLLVASGVWLVEMLRPGLVVESEPMAQFARLAEVTGFDLVIQPRVGIQNRFGRRFTGMRGEVHVRSSHGRAVGDTVGQLVAGRVQFTSLGVEIDELSSGVEDEAVPVELEFRGPWYVRRARVRVRGALSRAPRADEFGVEALIVNGAPVGVDRSVRVPFGDSVRVVLTFAYSTNEPTANYIVGASPTWGPREEVVIRLAGLPRPVVDAWRTVSFSVPSAPTPGVHHIIIVCGMEDSVAHLFSGTSWTAGAAIWHDGNDLVDLSVDALDTLRLTGLLGVAGFLNPGFAGRSSDNRLGPRAVALAPGASPGASPNNTQLRILLGTAIRVEFTPR